MKKRILSIILALSMLACMIPMGALTAFATYNKCPHCEMGMVWKTCPKCGGDGGYDGDDGWEDCDNCWGMGDVEGGCEHCGGSGVVEVTLPDAPRTHSGTDINIDNIAPGDWIVKKADQRFSNDWSQAYNNGYVTAYEFNGVSNSLKQALYCNDNFNSNSLNCDYYKAIDSREDDGIWSPLNEKWSCWFGIEQPRTVGAQEHNDGGKYRVIVPLYEEDLEGMEKLYYVVWSIYGDHGSSSFSYVDCAYTYFYQNDQKYTIEDYNEANNTDAVAFAILEQHKYNDSDFPFDQSGYIRFYKNSTETEDNFIGDAAVSYVPQW